MEHHLAQLNVARLRQPLDHPDTAGFVDALDPVNAAADAASGFVWRLQTDEGDATAVRVCDDDLVIVNLSVWDSIEALRAFAYHGMHRDVLRRRGEWFEPPTAAHLVLWWVPAGHQPGVMEAVDRLERLRHDGPSPSAFTFADRYSP